MNLTVAYGSSLGSCEDLVRTIADRGERSGFCTTLISLDERSTQSIWTSAP
ncbi:hypothetical protein ACWCP6_28030 [Streptomyces sp. NPDC002004]